jgi:phosphoribosylaminoimidazolecarboxamide formyltransferase/IMP cyclohydrolase
MTAVIPALSAISTQSGKGKNELSINYCDANNMSMVFTGNRHFKH